MSALPRAFAGPAWALAAVMIWSGWFAVTRLGFTHALTGFDVVAIRLFGGSLGMLPILLRARLRRRDYVEGVLLSACWGAPFLLLLTYGIQHTSASHGAALTPGTAPLFSLVLVWLLDGRRPSPIQFAGSALIVAGVVVLVTVLPAHDPLAWLGALALVTGAMLWATYGWRLKRSGLRAGPAAALTSLISAVIYVPLYLLSGVQQLTRAAPGELALQFFYQAILVGIVSLIAYNRAIAAIGPQSAASVSSLVPVMTLLVAGPIVDEWPSAIQAAAAAAITAGVLLTARRLRS